MSESYHARMPYAEVADAYICWYILPAGNTARLADAKHVATMELFREWKDRGSYGCERSTFIAALDKVADADQNILARLCPRGWR